MKWLKRVWQDFQQGENMDLYITVAASIVLAVLNLIDVVPPSWIAPLTLTVLALLSITMLGNRYRVEAVLERIGRQEGLPTMRLPQKEVVQIIGRSKELTVLGVTLSYTLRMHYGLLQEKLRRGEIIKVLLVDPDSPACGMVVRRSLEPTSTEATHSLICQSLEVCDQLVRETGGKLETRLTDCLLQFGAIARDLKSPGGVIYCWYYPFRTPHGDQPVMVLRSSDGYWYEFFKEQIEVLWDSASDHPVSQIEEGS